MRFFCICCGLWLASCAVQPVVSPGNKSLNNEKTSMIEGSDFVVRSRTSSMSGALCIAESNSQARHTIWERFETLQEEWIVESEKFAPKNEVKSELHQLLMSVHLWCMEELKLDSKIESTEAEGKPCSTEIRLPVKAYVSLVEREGKEYPLGFALLKNTVLWKEINQIAQDRTTN